MITRTRSSARLPLSSMVALCAIGLLASGGAGMAAQKPKVAPKPKVAQKPKPAPQAAPQKLATMVVDIPDTTVKLEMVRVPAGSVALSPSGGKGAAAPTKVKSFWIARTEATWEAYDPYMFGLGPSGAAPTTDGPDAVARPSKPYIPPDLGWGHNGLPVINVTHHAATQYCRWLSQVTGKKFRLPTEAEWEYACRSGAATALAPKGAALDAVAWHEGNSDGQTHAAGGKKPNAWGLVDMLGNVGEWANDRNGKPVLCGGSFDEKADRITSALRAYQTAEWNATDPQMPKSKWWLADGPFAGFRVVCDP